MPSAPVVATVVVLVVLVLAAVLVLGARRAAGGRAPAQDGREEALHGREEAVRRREEALGDRERAVASREGAVEQRSSDLRQAEAALAVREAAVGALAARTEAGAVRLAEDQERVAAARRLADETVEGARRAADGVLAGARREAGEVLTGARREADDVLAAARREAGDLLADVRRQVAGTREQARQDAEAVVAAAQAEALRTVEATAGLNVEEAREELRRRLVADAERDAEAQVRRLEAAARRSAQARATRAVTTAVQRLAGPSSSAVSVVSVRLPAPELKGRVIGKEGRNIRAFEALTGVDVLVDEVPGTVVLSGFDAERREVARVAMESLLLDGRISPPRIESAYADALAGADDRTEAAGHAAAARAGVADLHPELVRTLGRLRLRTSYGQDVLEHLVECALLAAALAAEVGADVALARRGAFLHDVGKALTAELPGTHAEVGAALARRCGESAAVVNAIAAHHDEVRPETVEAVLVQVADAISAARPGARHDELDQFVERMGRLESLVAEHGGVRRALAMSAGREVRVVVEPEEVRDEDLPRLADAIARHIEQDLSYPGEIRVTVVRELRASATAG
ncbi:ribonuclease Y [Cellulomonas marina]|uniref:Ribonuclease Y n=1 Tax=Cellulomonas marina TaxID=988821 RepID=A0A1I0VHZ6_9CELL|nr:ribonuclease Y [Cellulomonas marina]GIG27946.1 ribonuclease Y [Cellulomonas marina]SFA76099.1 ribonucrease Y [Cellulomonas marina]